MLSLLAMETGTIAIIVDVVIVVLLLIFLLVGLSRGFINSILSLVGTVGALAGAIFLCKPVLALINNVYNLSAALGNALTAPITGSNEIFSVILTPGNKETVLTQVQSMDLFGPIKSLITSMINNVTIPDAGVSIGSVISQACGQILAMIIVAIVIFILIKLVIFLLTKLFDDIKSIKIVGGLDRVLGAAFGLIKGAVCVCVFFVVIYLSSLIQPAAEVINPIKAETKLFRPTYELFDNFVQDQIKSIDWNSVMTNIITPNND